MQKVLIHNKSADGSAGRAHFKTNEDSLTASVFQLLAYLPKDILWEAIMLTLKKDRDKFPTFSQPQQLVNQEFWPKWNPEKTDNKSFVEPDVFLEFEHLDLIVEAKRFDFRQQKREQWEAELTAYENEFGQKKDKKLVLWALGGINTFASEEVKSKGGSGKSYWVVKSTWTSLLHAVRSILKSFENGPPNEHRLLSDICEAMGFHGFFVGTWLSEAWEPCYEISDSSLDYLTTHQEKYDSQRWLYSIPQTPISTTSIQTLSQWTPHQIQHN